MEEIQVNSSLQTKEIKVLKNWWRKNKANFGIIAFPKEKMQAS
jgi:hypothetical protein